MTVDETLSDEQRIALNYARKPDRTIIEAVLLLDRQLGEIVQRESEPGLKQLKLAWWREGLSQPVIASGAPPLLRVLSQSKQSPAPLAEVVDAWEMLVQEHLTSADMAQFARRRATAWLWAAGDVPPAVVAALTAAGQRWALADLALHLSPADEREAAVALLAQAPSGARLPRGLRWASMLEGLTLRRLAAALGRDGGTFGSMRKALMLTVYGRPYSWPRS